MKRVKKETGQVVVILLLVVVVGLAVGLAVVGRSITEISTSTKIEDSSRAFSAAEAGIERSLKLNSAYSVGDGPVGTAPTPIDTPLGNQSAAKTSFIPQLPLSGVALEYPSFGKESFAQFWLADPNKMTDGFPKKTYGSPDANTPVSYKIYFGKVDDTYYQSKPDDKPAIKVTTVYRDGNEIKSQSDFIDSHYGTGNSDRNAGFRGCNEWKPAPILTNDNPAGREHSFYCSATITLNFDTPPFGATGNRYPIMVRVRVVYSNIAHPVAIAPLGDDSFPPQASIFNSVGKAGSVQRTLQLFKEKSVMPNLFDYAIFSTGEVGK